MRHRIAGNRLGRKSAHRKATIRDIAKATLIRQRVCTTKAKAKEACKMVDKLITLGKKGLLAHKRRAFAILCDHNLVSDLFNKTAPRFKQRNGGYTRIIPLGYRRGDNAQLAFLELTEKEEVIISKPKTTAAGKQTETTAKLTPQKPVEQKEPKKEKVEPKTEVKPKTVATEPMRKEIPLPEKEKKGRSIVGNIRKMFQRKSPGN